MFPLYSLFTGQPTIFRVLPRKPFVHHYLESIQLFYQAAISVEIVYHRTLTLNYFCLVLLGFSVYVVFEIPSVTWHILFAIFSKNVQLYFRHVYYVLGYQFEIAHKCVQSLNWSGTIYAQITSDFCINTFLVSSSHSWFKGLDFNISSISDHRTCNS